MNFIEERVSNMVCSLNTPWNFSEIILPIDALSVLIEINGSRNLGSIGEKLGMSIFKMEEMVNVLGELNLIKCMEFRTAPKLSRGNNEQDKESAKRLFRGIKY